MQDTKKIKCKKLLKTLTEVTTQGTKEIKIIGKLLKNLTEVAM